MPPFVLSVRRPARADVPRAPAALTTPYRIAFAYIGYMGWLGLFGSGGFIQLFPSRKESVMNGFRLNVPVLCLVLMLSACGGGGSVALNPGFGTSVPEPVSPPAAPPGSAPAPQPVSAPNPPPVSPSVPQPVSAPAPQPVSAPEPAPPPSFGLNSQTPVAPVSTPTPAPPRADFAAAVPSTRPSGFPGGTGTTYDLRSYHPGSDYYEASRSGTYGGGDDTRSLIADRLLDVQERKNGDSVLYYFGYIDTWPGYSIATSKPGGATEPYFPKWLVDDIWLTYPANAGPTDTSVHVRTKREQSRPIHRGGGGGSGGTDKTLVSEIYQSLRENGFPFPPATDPFLTESYYQVTGVAQPTGGVNTSATWTGQAIVVDSNAGNVLGRGLLLGGDASLTVNFGADASATLDVSLTNWAHAGSSLVTGNTNHLDQHWTGLDVTNGTFSSSEAGRSLEGAFGDANKAAGVFDVFGTMKGGFVATKP